MEKELEKVDVLYDENGAAIRVQMDVELYKWLVEQVPGIDRHCLAVA